MTEPQSLFDRIGGQPAIEKLVDEFYERVIADASLSPYFAHTSMGKLKMMQKVFLSVALGGPVPDDDIDLASAHAGRGIGREQLTHFTELLLDTLKQIGLSHDDANAVIARVATYSSEILGDAAGIDG